MILGELAEISIGYSFRKGIEDFRDKQGNALLIQAGDLPSNDIYMKEAASLHRIVLDDRNLSLALRSGDILFAYRCSAQSRFKASIFATDSEIPVIASSTLYVIRPDTKRVLPEYLVVYFNSDKGQKQFQSLALGASVRAVSVRELKNLSIPIPAKEKQKALVALWQNMQKQNSILRRRIQLQEKFVNDFTSILTKSH